MAIGLSLVGMAACSDPDEPITSMEFSRLFSPTQLEAKAQSTTGMKLTWFAISASEKYVVEIYADDAEMEFSGTPLTYEVAPSTKDARSEISWTLAPGTLEGETVYSVRLKAVDNNIESKWASTTFETGTEQIFNNVPATEITKTSVTLTWPAGIAVTTIKVQKSGEVIKTHTLTAEEIAAGKVTINELNYESTYTFYIYNGEKQRGKIQVQTLPNFTPVTTALELMDAIGAAEAGEVIMLTANAVYDFTDAAALGKEEAVKSLKIDKDIVLNTNNNATIKGIYFQINGGASMEFANITLDGEGGSGDQVFNYKEEGNYDKLYIHDAVIKNYTKGLIYINVAASIKNITVNNTIVSNIECSGGDFIDCRLGYIENLNLTNSTIYNCAAKRDIFRLDGTGQSNTFAGTGLTINVNVDHCTFANVGNGSANYRFFYHRFADNKITFTNNVVAGFNNTRGFTNDGNTDASPMLKNNFYYNTLNLMSLAADNTQAVKWFDTDGAEVTEDPFKDAANGNFTIIYEKIKDKEAGDPRWLSAQE